MLKSPKILLSKVGLDGHDRGVKVIFRALQDAGIDVFYTGIRNTPKSIVETAIDKKVDIIGVSILSGAHLDLFPKIFQELSKRNAQNIVVIAGGIIPDKDRIILEDMGVELILGPGSETDQIVAFIKNNRG
ncbi:MAG: cobalamin B12-binding domain-containing protein [SAR202 cluster bacterium]|nr:cobalamin B12-binding domain-containing protein [SAR202 cluster bacterium]